MKENKGITLIALIVTIIVLLILAAVSIATLMGKNGVITNAQKTSTQNAYYGALEQVKLAYMAVRTEIMSQVVANGSYAPAEHAGDLATIVRNDLSDTSTWEVSGENDSAGTKNVITIIYTDTAIDQGVIKNIEGSNLVPLKEGSIKCTITLGNATQNSSDKAAELKMDID